MTSKDSLGDRIKWYESRYTDQQFMKMVPVMARLDGRAFHTFTKGLDRPYCKQLSKLMVDTTKFLVHETNARCGYTQSDEISLVWLAEDWESDIFFSGKLQKMNSILSSMTSVYFNSLLPEYLPSKKGQMPLFDCRVFQVPNDTEAVNCFIWREQDASRNSIQMAARSLYSHDELMNKNTSQLHDMLFEKGVNWNDYPTFFKRGTYVRRRVIDRPFTPEEIMTLPERHAARNNPDLRVRRSSVMEEDFPQLTKVENREEVILYGAEPIIKSSEEKDVS
jgi:tRNA(His) guanylyltransferase